MNSFFTQLHAADNIGVALRDIPTGSQLTLPAETITTAELIPAGHKFALEHIPADRQVVKFGQWIGVAGESLPPGTWVHTHNLKNPPIERDYELATAPPPLMPSLDNLTFQGIRRASGRVGTRNYIAIISSVNCSASVSKYAARQFEGDALRDYPNVDGVVAFTHHGGCGMQFAGLKHNMLNRVLAGMAQHPNIGAYVLVGLGCEQASIGYLIEDNRLVQIGDKTSRPDSDPPVIVMQELGGTRQTVDALVAQVESLLPRANEIRRESVPAANLMLGTQCGGSDGNSGISANPALGFASDLLVAAQATVVLAETPEVYGAEHLLTRRARSPEVASKLLERIDWWKWYAEMFGGELDNNPSVGNKAGGLTTIAEKSLGAVAKGGTTALNAVYEYAEPIRERGLVFMDTPGFDPASVTGLVAGGANVVAFTTGRGSCFGCKPVPSIKIATNSLMFERMSEDMDVDAGTVLQGEPIEQVGARILDKILRVASGEKTKSELHGIGQEEFVPWMVGPQL